MLTKRTDRIELPRQLRTNADLGRKIRVRAEINRRSIQQEILYLIEQGLKSEDVGICQTPSVNVSQQMLLRADDFQPKKKHA